MLRRSLISAVVLIPLAIVAGLVGASAFAQRGRTGAPPSTQAAGAPRPAPLPPPDRHVVPSDGHAMAVWSRRPATPKGAVLLVHGRTWSARPDFDLQVPGLQRSVLVSLSALGYAAYAVDLRGYGETPRDATGWMTPRRAAQDIVNVMTWVGRQHPALPKPTLVGWSRGAALSMIAAQMAPDQISQLVLFGFVFDPELSFADADYSATPLREKNTADSARSDFISPAVTPRAVIEAFVEQAMRADPILADVRRDSEFNLAKPAQLRTPTLVLFGHDDPGVPLADAGKFFAAIASEDKQMVSLPGSDHAAHLEDTHDAWIAAVVNFITRPPARR